MSDGYIYLGESKTTIAIACPKCKAARVLSKDLLLGFSYFKQNYTCSCGFESSSVNRDYFKARHEKNEHKTIRFITIGLVILIIGIILCLTRNEDGDIQTKIGLALIINGIASFVIAFNIGKSDNELKASGEKLLGSYIEKDNDEILIKCAEILNEKVKQSNIPANKKIINITNKTKGLAPGKWYFWVNDDSLNLFPKIEINNNYPDESLRTVKTVTKKKISIDKIEYFYTQGEIFRENKITGGGGGGSSLGGAVVGGIIAGGAGAVIGSRKKNEEIKSELVTHDTRETFMNYFDNEGNKKSIFMDFNDYQTLLDLIPQKDYIVISALKTNYLVQSLQNQEKIKTITDQIRELAKLKEEGLLTEEEFIEKKKILLSKIG